MKNRSRIRGMRIALIAMLAAGVIFCVAYGSRSGLLYVNAYEGELSDQPSVLTPGDSCWIDAQEAHPDAGIQRYQRVYFYFYVYKQDAEAKNDNKMVLARSDDMNAILDVPSEDADGRAVKEWRKAGQDSASNDVYYYAVYDSCYTYKSGGYGQDVTVENEYVFEYEGQTFSVRTKGAYTFEREGYRIHEWNLEGYSNNVGVDTNLDLTIDKLNRTYVARWMISSLSVNYNPGDGVGSIVNRTEELNLIGSAYYFYVLSESEAKAQGIERANYKLTGWQSSTVIAPGGRWEAIPGVVMAMTDRNVELTAVWTPKTPSSISLNVADGIYDNDDVASKITATPDRTGTVTLEYKGRNQGDSAYSTAVPSAPGEYTVRATLAETDDYASAEETADLTLLNSKINVGVTYKSADGTGKDISQNKELTRKDGKWSLTLLSSADFTRSGYKHTGWKDKSGKTYDLGAEYEVTPSTGDLTFEAVWTEKQKGTVDIDMKKPLYVGAEIKYDIDKNSEGDVTVEYKKKDDKDEKYSDKKPTEPGKYTVRATLKETDDYTSAEDTADFEIAYLTAPENPYSYKEVKNSAGTVTDVNVIPAEGYSISSSADGSYGSSVSYTAVKAAGGSVYLKREKDKAVTEPVKLTEYKVEDSPKITVPAKIYYGTTYTVTTTALTPATKTVSYKKAGAADSTYSTALPTDPGKYTVRLSAPASGFYDAVNVTKDFSIDYLEAPTTKATISGEKGEGKWYISDVYIKAPSGYEICTATGGYYSDSIKWNDKITKIYYRRTSDGAKTDAVEVDFDVNIDKKNPTVVFDSSLGIAEGQKQISLYTDSITFTLSDDNLKTVTVNGKKYDVSDGKCVIILDTGLMAETKTVVAMDEAGNSYTFTIELIPAWMQSNVMPLDKEVLLSAATEYSLEPGRDCVIDGEGILYKGGSKFYVRTTGSFKFITN